MSGFEKFIKLLKSEPTAKKRKKTKRPWEMDESKYLGKAEVRKLISFCNNYKKVGLQDKKFTRLREWFMVELGLNTGLRVQEMADLKGSNLLIDKDRSSIVLIGKGNKKRAIWISSKFKKTCKTFLNYKVKFGYSVKNEDYLLNNLKGEKISKRALQKFFKKIIRKIKLPEHYSIHNLRHTYTTFLLKSSNHNYRLAQKQLGHSSIRTTQIYAGVVETEGRKAIEKLYG